jgi:hypothetical protein
MSATKHDFPIEQGSSFKLQLIYKDQNNNPIDLTDYCARLTWTTNSGETSIFTTENMDLSLYSFTIDGPNGTLVLMLPASKTNTLNFDIAQYDLEIQSNIDLYTGGGKEVIRLLYGTITLIKRYSQTNTLLQC